MTPDLDVPDLWSLCIRPAPLFRPSLWSPGPWAGVSLWGSLVITALCLPTSGHHRQQEEQSSELEELPQPQIDEQSPTSPAWALPAPTAKPGMATTRRQVGEGADVPCKDLLSPHQAPRALGGTGP